MIGLRMSPEVKAIFRPVHSKSREGVWCAGGRRARQRTPDKVRHDSLPGGGAQVSHTHTPCSLQTSNNMHIHCGTEDLQSIRTHMQARKTAQSGARTTSSKQAIQTPFYTSPPVSMRKVVIHQPDISYSNPLLASLRKK
jgi:hypothetical protein